MARTPWVDFLARVPETRSNTSVCLKIVDPEVMALPAEMREALPAADRGAARCARMPPRTSPPIAHAPPGLRIWTGATVEKERLEALMPWLDWAFAEEKQALAKAA